MCVRAPHLCCRTQFQHATCPILVPPFRRCHALRHLPVQTFGRQRGSIIREGSALGGRGLDQRTRSVCHGTGTHGGDLDRGAGRRRMAHGVQGLDVPQPFPRIHRDGRGQQHATARSPCAHQSDPAAATAVFRRRRRMVESLPNGPLAGPGAHQYAGGWRGSRDLVTGHLHAQGHRFLYRFGHTG